MARKRKPAAPLARGPRRSGALLLALTDEERAVLDDAARREGLATTPWVRMVALRAARP